MAGGRPTKYKPEYCEELIEFFTRDLYTVDDEGKVRPNALPTLEAFSDLIGVDTDTLAEWGRVHPEFSGAVKRAKAKQADMLANGGLRGVYKETMSIFLLKNNHGYTDKVEQTHQGPDGGDIKQAVSLNINFVKP